MDRLLSQGRPPPYVSSAGPDFWVVHAPASPRLALWSLGLRGFPFFGPMSARYRKPLDFPAMGAMAMRLRDLGFAFGAGRDWAPAEMVRFLRDEGHVDGDFSEIVWAGEGGWEVRPL